MHKDLQRTCTAIVVLIKPFVQRRSRSRFRRGFLKLPIWLKQFLSGREFYETLKWLKTTENQLTELYVTLSRNLAAQTLLRSWNKKLYMEIIMANEGYSRLL